MVLARAQAAQTCALCKMQRSSLPPASSGPLLPLGKGLGREQGGFRQISSLGVICDLWLQFTKIYFSTFL